MFPFLLLGDLNSHNPLRGCSKYNSEGKIIENLTDENENDLSILNTPEPTHFSANYNLWSTIDLILSSATFSDHISTFHNDDLSSNNYVPQMIQLSHQTHTKMKFQISN